MREKILKPSMKVRIRAIHRYFDGKFFLNFKVFSCSETSHCMVYSFLGVYNYGDYALALRPCLTCVSRSADVPTRQRYVVLVESVRDGGGIVRVFSSLHVSGEREKGKKYYTVKLLFLPLL